MVIAVLPFENVSDGLEYEGFARGFVLDVATELSRFPALEVVHPHTSFGLSRSDGRGEHSPNVLRPSPLADASTVETPLEVTYWLRGSLQRGGDTLRVTARLEEAQSGRQIWADRYDVPTVDVLAVQDEIAASVAGALAIALDSRRLGQARRAPVSSLEAYDCWLRGFEHLRRGTVSDDAHARTFFERALELDPHYARAHAGISLSHFNEWSCQAWERWDDKERLAFAAAERAVDLDDGDAMVHLVLGRVHLFRREFGEAERHVEQALSLNPNDADVLAQASLCRAYLGHGEASLANVRLAIRLNPTHDDWYIGCLGLSLFILRRAEEGVAVASRAPRATVDMPAYLAGGHARLGDHERAQECIDTFLADFTEKITFGRAPDPGEPLRWTLHVNPFRSQEDADYLVESLRLAGLPADPDEGRVAAAVTDARDVAEPGGVFRETQGVRMIGFSGLAVQLSEVKGFEDLAVLFARAGEEVHCLELAGRPAEAEAAPLLDAEGRRQLRTRARELQQELDDAEAAHDPGRVARARAELDQLVEQLGKTLGLGGRSRRLGSPAERARSTVTWRIRSAIRKIAAAHPQLGRHLENTVQTGTYCSYTPEAPVGWSF